MSIFDVVLDILLDGQVSQKVEPSDGSHVTVGVMVPDGNKK